MSTKKAAAKVEVDPDDDVDDKVDEDDDDAISLDKANNARACDTDEEQELEQFSSSDDDDDENREANADDAGDGLLNGIDDDEMGQDEDYGAGGGGGDEMAADEDEQEDDDEAGEDEDDARRLLQQQQQRQQHQQPAKKAKKEGGGGTTPPTRKSTPKVSKANMTPGQLKQLENKGEWNAIFKDSKDELTAIVCDYVYVAGMQALTGAHNFRKLVLEYKNEDVKVEALADSVSRLESMVHKTLKIARSDSDKQMVEIIDFVTGATSIDVGSAEKAKAALCCDITKKKPVGDEKLICLRAEHPLRDAKAPPGATQFKQKVVHDSLRALIDATWFFVNMLSATEKMVVARLSHMKGIKNHQTTVAEALKKLREDEAKTALPTTFIKKLRMAQIAINGSKLLLALPTVPTTTDDE